MLYCGLYINAISCIRCFVNITKPIDSMRGKLTIVVGCHTHSLDDELPGIHNCPRCLIIVACTYTDAKFSISICVSLLFTLNLSMFNGSHTEKLISILTNRFLVRNIKRCFTVTTKMLS